MTTAVSGLSKEQALLVLSTKNLTNAQKEQVLLSAGIIATEDKISASVLSQALAKSTLSATEKESLLTKLGLIDATTGEAVANATCTKETLLKTLATKGIVGADADAIISSIGLITANGAQSVSFDLLTASIWANIKALGTWLITNPIGWAILGGTAIFGLGKAYDALTDSVDEVKDRTDGLMESFNSAISKANENAKSVESVGSRYEELSKGVNSLGENVSLTTDEYSEYNDIVNQIADMFPTLISGYTEEGNAILSLKGNVNELRDAYKEAQTEAYNLLIVSGEDSDGNDIITNYQNQVNGNESSWSKNSSYIDGEAGAKDAIDVITKLTGALTPDEFRKAYDDLCEEYENVWYSDKIQDALKSSGFRDVKSKWSEITEEDLANVKYSAQATIQTYNAEIDANLKNVETYANAFLLTNDDYSKLSDQSKTAASLIVNNLNEDIANGFENKEDVGAYVAKIVSMIKDNPDMNDALVGLFTLDSESLNPTQMKEQVDVFINKIAEWMGEDPVELKVRLGFDDTDDLYTKYKNAIKSAQDKFGTDETKFFTDNSINTTEEIDNWLKVAEAANSAAEAEQKYLNPENRNSTDSFTEDQNKQLDDFQSRLASIKTALTDISTLSPTQILDLIQEFNLDADTATSSTEGLRSELERVAKVQLDSVQATLKEMERGGYLTTQQYKALLEVFEQLAFSSSNQIADLEKNINSLSTVLSDVKKKKSLSAEETAKLINEHSELASAVKKTSDGYLIEKDALTQLIDKYKTDANTAISQQITKTQSAIDGAKARIKAYETERKALSKLAQAAGYTSSSNLTYSKMISSSNGSIQNAYSKYGKETVERARQNSVDNIQVKVGETSLQDLLEQLSGYSTSSKKKTDSSSKKFSQIIDWNKISIESLTKAISRLDTKLSSTGGWDKQIRIIDKMISKQNNLVKAYTKSEKSYQKAYSSSIKGLSKKYVDKIENGETFSIENFSGKSGEKLYNKIINAQEAYNNLVDTQTNKENAQYELKKKNNEKIQKQIDKYSANIEKNNALLENTTGYEKQNKILRSIISDQKKSYALQIKLAETDEERVKLKEELKKLTAENAKKQFDNIQSEFDNKSAINAAKQSRVQSQIDVVEAEGYEIGAEFYKKQLSINKTQQERLLKEKAALLKSISGMTKGTQDWYDAQETLYSLSDAIDDCAISTATLNTQIQQLKWDRFDKIIDSMSKISDESNFMIDLLSYEDLYDSETGKLTDAGTATIGLRMSNLETYKALSVKYGEEIATIEKEITKALNEGSSTGDLEERREALLELQRESIKSAQAEEQSIKDLNKNAIQVEIDNYKELIAKKNEALDAEKELYEFQKSITKEKENAMLIEKKLAALEGDNSDQARKERRELESKLKESQESIRDMQYNKEIEMRKENNNSDAENYEKSKTEELKNISVTLSEYVAISNENASKIIEKVSNVANEVGYNVSDSLKSIWTSNNPLNGFNENFDEAINGESGVMNAIENIAYSLNDIYEKIDINAIKTVNDTVSDYSGFSLSLLDGDKILTDSSITKLGQSENINSFNFVKPISELIGLSSINTKLPNFNQLSKNNTSPIEIDNSITIQGNVTEDVFPKVEELVKKQTNLIFDQTKGRGTRTSI